MRFIIHAKIPTEAGNKMVQDPNFIKYLDKLMEKVKKQKTCVIMFIGLMTISLKFSKIIFWNLEPGQLEHLEEDSSFL